MRSREDAVLAIRDLLTDLKSNRDSWENPTLERYLDALTAWLEDSSEMPDQGPSWDLIIDMLKAAKIYE